MAGWRSRRIRLLLAGLAALLVAWLALGNRLRLSLVVGQSMQPTYEERDVLLVDHHAYRAVDPKRGDIVIVRRNEEFWVKRVVGMPGEEVEVSDGVLLVDGRVLEEPYRTVPGPLRIAKGWLGPGKFAVLGDNRSLPALQQVHGVVAREEIVGRVVSSWKR
jgi:signal peptidase I